MKKYNTEEILYQIISKLYERRGMSLNSSVLPKLQKWYEGFIKRAPKDNNWQCKILNEVYRKIEEGCLFDVLSSDFWERISSALALGSAYLDRFAHMNDKYFSIFVDRLTFLCGIAVAHILTRNMESADERLKITSADIEDDFYMDIYGVYPTKFLNEGIFLVGIVRKGSIHTGDIISMPYCYDCNDYGRNNEAMINSVGEVREMAMIGRKFSEVRAGDVCVLSVKYNGTLLNDYPFPFHTYKTGPIPDIRTASEEVREKEYADEYVAFLSFDRTCLKLSASNLRYLDSMKKTLGISENRAKEIECDCVRLLLPENYLDCFESVKKCLNAIDE